MSPSVLHRTQRTLTQLASWCGVLLCAIIGITYVLKGVTLSASQQNSGDFAIWITVHEFLSRGHVLYRDVWDHKDPGFFALTHPLFTSFGVMGLYIAASISTVLFGLGIFFAVRPLVGRLAAAISGTLATFGYVSLPSYWATYTENSSIGPAMMGAGLAARYPFMAGAFLALACTVKISTLLVFGAVCAVKGLLYILRPSTRADAGRSLMRLVTGFIGTGALFFLIFGRTFSVYEWLTVVTFNREYAQRRSDPFQFDQLLTLARTTPFETQMYFGLFCLTLALTVIFLLACSPKEHPQTGGEAVSIAGTCAIAGYAVTALQYPPSFQHWQYLGGTTVFAAAVTTTSALAMLPLRWLKGVAFCLLSIPLIQYGQFAIPYTWAGGWSHMFQFTNEKTNLSDVTKRLPDHTTIAIFAGNDARIDLTEAPPHLRLACRFFYQFKNFSPRFQSDIDRCLDQSPQLVFLKTTFNPDLTRSAIERLKRDYVLCGTFPADYAVYGKSGSECLSIKG